MTSSSSRQQSRLIQQFVKSKAPGCSCSDCLHESYIRCAEELSTAKMTKLKTAMQSFASLYPVPSLPSLLPICLGLPANMKYFFRSWSSVFRPFPRCFHRSRSRSLACALLQGISWPPSCLASVDSYFQRPYFVFLFSLSPSLTLFSSTSLLFLC